MSENSALDPQADVVNYGRSQTSSSKFKVKVGLWQHKVGRAMETRRAHLFIIFLIVVDVGCIIADLAYRLLSQRCGDGRGHHDPTWVDVLSHISLGISATFLIEIILALFSFGLRYYNPFGGIPLASLHLFDAMVIITTLVLELTLRGREEELASLLVVLRLWRIVKLVEGIALGAGVLESDQVAELAETKVELANAKQELQTLRLRLHTINISYVQ